MAVGLRVRLWLRARRGEATSIFLGPPMKEKRPSPFSVPMEAIERNLTCSGLGLGLGAAAGVRPSPMGPALAALSVSCEYQVRELTASLSSSTAAFIAMVLSEIVFPENELAHSCIGPKMRSMLPFFSIALLRVAQSLELTAFLTAVAQ